MKIEAEYPVSMSGMHGTGKKTLRDGLSARAERLVAVDYKLLQLGRMVDEDGLRVFRERAEEQDRLVREHMAQGRWPVTSRSGILDVAITACSMSRLGRIDPGVVDGFVASLADDLARAAMPRALVIVLTPAEVLQERLLARDQQAGSSNARGLGKLARMADFMQEIFVGEHYPHALVERIVRSYRDTDDLLVVDTGQRDRGGALADVLAFLERRQILPGAGAGERTSIA
jgi:hypothetical protein